jgi:rod shape-determining protein MreD
MKYFIAAVAAFLIAIIYVAALPSWRILGVTPNLVLIFVACWAMLRGQSEAMVVVPIAALASDLATSYPLGTSLLALAPVVLLAALYDRQVIETDFVPTLAVVAISSLAYGIITIAVLTATGHDIPWFAALRVAVLPSIIVNALFTPIIYLPIRWFTPSRRPEMGLRPTILS